MTKSIQIALIGAGYIAHYHVRGLLQQPGVELTWVCSLEEDANRAFAKQYGIPNTTTDAASLFGRPDIDAVILSTPNTLHAPFAEAFLHAGKDVFIEKPMAINPDEGLRIQAAAQQTGTLVMVGHMWRFDTEVLYIRSVVQSGQIGSIVKTKGYGIHENWGPEGWFVQKALAGGGALADMGVHALDTVRFLLGDPQPTEVYAKIGTYYGDYDVDDTGLLMITWDTGATSLIESGWWHPHMDGPEAATQIFGTDGYASLFPTKLKLRIAGTAGEFIPPMPPRAEHCDQVIYTRQMAHFVDCIRTRQQPVPGWDEGQTIVRIVAAAYQSSQTNQVIPL